MEKTERRLTDNVVFDGRVIRVNNDDVLLPDGSKAKREIVHHRGGCCVLPVLDDKYFILVRQYRYAYHEEILEIPAGKLEIDEEPRDCAIRELMEETGYRASSVVDYGIIYPTPGYTDEKIYMYMARGITAGASCPDDGEYLDVVEVAIDDALEMIGDNTIKDSKTIIAILKYVSGRR